MAVAPELFNVTKIVVAPEMFSNDGGGA